MKLLMNHFAEAPPIQQAQSKSQRRAWIYAAMTKCACLDNSVSPSARLERFYHTLEGLRDITPRELMNVFPPEKMYDGDKYECKDYFTTMEVITQHGIDTPLGDYVFEFLYDYMNRKTRQFVVRWINVIDDMRHADGLPSMIESFLESQGASVTMFRKITGADGRELAYNTQDGTIAVISTKKPRTPSWWKIIEGGQG